MTAVEVTIQVLACSALVGLLGAVGLRLTYAQVRAAFRRSGISLILIVNFVLVPALAAGVVSFFGVKEAVASGMLLLAAAPFAPVVPVFARMARADLPLAAALTGVMPVISALLTPFVAQVGLSLLGHESKIQFRVWITLASLLSTITLPLAAGVFVRHQAPQIGQRLVRPMEILAEAIGAISLAFVAVTQFGLILEVRWSAWVAMAFLSEASLFLGWIIGGRARGSRQVIALGTSNRNIALALLIAIQSFPGTAVVSAVAGNGLLLIVFGLVHVAWWRFGPRKAWVGGDSVEVGRR